MRTSRLAMFLGLVLVAFTGEAHRCGESPITLRVGQRATYRITADVLESEESHYNVSINSDPTIASVAPDNFDRLAYGEFVITGLAPGTNFIILEWSYAPNNASGFCSVEVRVTEPSTDPRDVADETTAAEADEAGVASDPVNTYTGEYVLAEPSDLDLGGPLPVRFTRYYASGLKRQPLAKGGLGSNWLHNYEVRLVPGPAEIDVVFLGGKVIPFEWDGTQWLRAKPGRVPYQLKTEGTDYLLLDPERNWVYQFDGSGQLTRVEDTRGNALELTYEGGQLRTVSDGLGRTLTFAVSGFQRLTTVSDGTRTVTFSYVGDNLVSVTDRAGGLTRYEYDNSNAGGALMTAKVLPDGNRPNQQVYDSEGRVIEQTRAEGGTYLFEYDGLETTITNPDGSFQRHRHDAQGNLVELTDESGNTIRSEFDVDGRRVRETARNGGVYTWTHHAGSGELATATMPGGLSLAFERGERDFRGFKIHDVARITYFDGTHEMFEYDDAGNVVGLTDRNGQLTRFAYNAQGRMVAFTNAAGGAMTFDYNADGTRSWTRRILPDGSMESTGFGYDALKRLNRVEYPDGRTVLYAYNPLDLVTSRTDEESATTSYEYSANGLLTRIVYPLGNTIRFEYDQMHEVTNVLDQAGNHIERVLDSMGRLAALTDRNNHTQAFQYDPVGRLTNYVDGAGQSWVRTHDVEGRPVSQADPLGHVRSYAYDAAGRVTSISLIPETIQLSYDAMGRPVGMEFPPGQLTSLAYQADGLLAGVTLPGGIASEYDRDALGAVETIQDPTGAAWRILRDSFGRPQATVDPLSRTNTHRFDARDRLTRVDFADEHGWASNSFNGRGQITRKTFSDGTVLDFSYDSNGRLVSATGLALAYDEQDNMVSCNGLELGRDAGGRLISVALAPGRIIQYAYDARNLLTNVTDWLGGSTTLQYDAASRLTSISRPNGVTTSHSYDAANRLASIHEQSTETVASIELTRDGAGQIVSALKELPLQPSLVPLEVERTFDAASQIIGAEYDALGRMTGDGPRGFEWDLASRLIRVEDGSTDVTFEYDAFGNLLAWTDGAERREFVWNYGLVLRSPVIIRDDQGDLLYAIHTSGGELLYTIEAATGVRHFHHFDEMGNTLFLTDDAGAVTDAFAYSAYGRPLGRTGTTATPFAFAGRYSGLTRPGQGLVYLRHRWLDTGSGRFLSRDPNWGISMNPNELNPYGYTRSNPLRYIDPLGLDARVNQSGVHTDISVDIWQGDQVVGTLTVSYAAKGYTGKFGGVGEAFSTVIGGTQGEFSIDYKKGSIKENTSPDAISRGTQIIIEGTREQDERLRRALAGIIGANGDVAFVGRGQSMIRQFIHQTRSGKNIHMVIDATIDDWETYRALTQSCNDFTDAMLDIYFGENWYVGPIFEGDGLTQELKAYLNRPRGPVLDPNGIARITGDTVVR